MTRTSNPPRYWFATKRYGWGWGRPLTWQGTACYLAFFGTVLAASVWLAPSETPVAYSAVIGLSTLALLAICWRKGEPPRWRWGDE